MTQRELIAELEDLLDKLRNDRQVTVVPKPGMTVEKAYLALIEEISRGEIVMSLQWGGFNKGLVIEWAVMVSEGMFRFTGHSLSEVVAAALNYARKPAGDPADTLSDVDEAIGASAQ